MPKKPGGISKSQRYQKVKETIVRMGIGTRSEITGRVANLLGVSKQEIEQGVYRDLKELEAAHEVTVEYYDRNGLLIENFDISVHKNTSCKFRSLKFQSSILGAGLLEGSGCEVFANKKVSSELAIASYSPANSKSCTLIWSIGNSIFSLNVQSDALPINLIIYRVSENQVNAKDITATYERWGTRLVLLGVPIAKVSGFKSPLKPGHAMIQLEPDNRTIVEDLHSTNGTKVVTLKDSELDETQKLLSNLQHKTSTRHWTKAVERPEETIEIKGTESVFDKSILIQFSNEFSLLVLRK